MKFSRAFISVHFGSIDERLLISMEKVEFLFKCIQDGKISSEQACAMLEKSKSNLVTGKSVPAADAPGPTASPAAVTTGALKQPIASKT